MVSRFLDFCTALRESGFSMSGGGARGIYTVIPCDWNEPTPAGCDIAWHTGEADTDPWEWRMRVLEELDDVSYAKCFFSAGGFIAKPWVAAFYAARRQGMDFDTAYERGLISQTAKRIYEVVCDMEQAPYHEIKARGGFIREENNRFERAIIELQMKMYLTICGRAQRISQQGIPYGWNSTVLCTVESFWAQRGLLLDEIALPSLKQAYDQISAQVIRLNPDAQEKNIRKFIYG